MRQRDLVPKEKALPFGCNGGMAGNAQRAFDEKRMRRSCYFPQVGQLLQPCFQRAGRTSGRHAPQAALCRSGRVRGAALSAQGWSM